MEGRGKTSIEAREASSGKPRLRVGYNEDTVVITDIERHCGATFDNDGNVLVSTCTGEALESIRRYFNELYPAIRSVRNIERKLHRPQHGPDLNDLFHHSTAC